MPRCNLTLKQKSQIIELSSRLSTEELAKKFRVHPTTVTRTLQKKTKILDQVSRVNPSFKTVQTIQHIEEHDSMILEYIKSRQEANEPLTIEEICDKAIEYGKTLDRDINSKRGWWRRFRLRCNIVRSKLNPKQSSRDRMSKDNNTGSKPKKPQDTADKETSVITKRKGFTFKVKETNIHNQSIRVNKHSNKTKS